jgi:hypothetical protein
MRNMFLLIVILAVSAGIHVCQGVPVFVEILQVDENKPPVAVQLEKPDLFVNVKLALFRQTNVPLRLPSYIPFADDPKEPVYAIVESADLDNYEIQIAFTNDCNGGNSCHYGTVRGSRSTLVENDGARIPVSLNNGIKGYFVDFTCGAHCDDAAIGWTEGGYHYSISLKAEKKQEMIEVANSAIPTRSTKARTATRRH